MTHTYQISGMTCSKCVAKVKSELLKLGEVTSAEVQLEFPQATISMNRHIPLIQLQESISKAGSYVISESGDTHESMKSHSEGSTDNANSYFPIALIFGYISVITILIQVFKGTFSWMQWMTHFMAGFFFVFSFFKFLNLKGFSEGYGTYDIVAKKFPLWGYIYPFLELMLGILLLSGLFPLGTNIAILLLMGISTIGVIQSLLKKSTIQCACLGTVIKLPLGKVTLTEDLLMVAMSAVMIISML